MSSCENNNKRKTTAVVRSHSLLPGYQAIFFMRDFLRLKNGPFSQKAKKKHHLMRLKTEQFHHRFFWTPVWHGEVHSGRLLCKIIVRFKNGPFSSKAKNIILCDSKRSSFITDVFELQLDTPTLIIPSFRMTQARGCKRRFQSDPLRTYLWYLVGFICNTIIQ